MTYPVPYELVQEALEGEIEALKKTENRLTEIIETNKALAAKGEEKETK